MRRSANAERFKATRGDVIVVPGLAPKMILSDAINDIMPAFTSPTVMIVVTMLDWTTAVISTPAAVPLTGVLVICWIRFRQ